MSLLVAGRTDTKVSINDANTKPRLQDRDRLEQRKSRLCKSFKSTRAGKTEIQPAWTNRVFLDAVIIPLTGGTAAVLDHINTQVRTHTVAKTWTPLLLMQRASYSMVLRLGRLCSPYSSVQLITVQDLRQAVHHSDFYNHDKTMMTSGFKDTLQRHTIQRKEGIYFGRTSIPNNLATLVADAGIPTFNTEQPATEGHSRFAGHQEVTMAPKRRMSFDHILANDPSAQSTAPPEVDNSKNLRPVGPAPGSAFPSPPPSECSSHRTRQNSPQNTHTNGQEQKLTSMRWDSPHTGTPSTAEQRPANVTSSDHSCAADLLEHSPLRRTTFGQDEVSYQTPKRSLTPCAVSPDLPKHPSKRARITSSPIPLARNENQVQTVADGSVEKYVRARRFTCPCERVVHRQSPLHRCLWQLMKVRAKERAQHGEAEGFMTEILEFFTSVPPAQFQRAVMHIYNVIKERQHQFHGHFKRALLEISEVASHLAEGKDPQVAQIRGVMALWQYEFRDQPVSIPNWEGFCQPRRIPISPKRVPRTSEDASGLYVIGSFRDLLNNRISRNNEPDIVRTIAEEIYALAKQSTGRDYAIDMYNR